MGQSAGDCRLVIRTMSLSPSATSVASISRDEGSSSHGRKGKKPRTYGSACDSCQRRKIKCGLQKPSCSNCIRGQADKLQRTSKVTSHRGLSKTEALQRRVAQLEAELVTAKTDRQMSSSSSYSRSSPIHGGQQPAPSGRPPATPRSPEPTGTEDTDWDLFEGHNSLDARRSHFAASTYVSDSFERLVSTRLHGNDDAISPLLAADLIRAYFLWWNSLHCYLYKPEFYCCLVVEGPHFSPFLLNVVLSQGARLLSTGGVEAARREGDHMSVPPSDFFLKRAKLSLVDEVDRGNSSTLLQGLVLMAGREASCGHLDQAWLYTGMAIRVLRALGLSRPPFQGRRRYKPCSFQRRELYSRLFWTVYCWDKTLSLTLGRQSTFAAPEGADPECIVDESEDHVAWDPHLQDHFATVALSRTIKASAEPSRVTAVFRRFAHLCLIIDDILRVRYGDTSAQSGDVAIDQLDGRLQEWEQATVQQDINLTTANVDVCPSPHKLQLGVLYHCSYILLHRPSIAVSVSRRSSPQQKHAMSVCRLHTLQVHDLIRLRERDMGLANLSYLVCHCLYAAVTINVLDLRSASRDTSAAAAEQLAFGIRALEFCSWQSAGIQKAVKMIKAYLAHPFGSTVPQGMPGQRSREPSIGAGEAEGPPEAHEAQQQQQQQQRKPPGVAVFAPETVSSLSQSDDLPDMEHGSLHSETWTTAPTANFGMLWHDDPSLMGHFWTNSLLPDFPDELSGAS